MYSSSGPLSLCRRTPGALVPNKTGSGVRGWGLEKNVAGFARVRALPDTWAPRFMPQPPTPSPKPLAQQRLYALDAVRFLGLFIVPPAGHAGETDGDSGTVPRRELYTFERQFKYQFGFD
jgi:hypothetical protein